MIDRESDTNLLNRAVSSPKTREQMHPDIHNTYKHTPGLEGWPQNTLERLLAHLDPAVPPCAVLQFVRDVIDERELAHWLRRHVSVVQLLDDEAQVWSTTRS